MLVDNYEISGGGIITEALAEDRSHAASDPNVIAEEMVREAALRRSGGRRDDMTCICIRISETLKCRKKDARMA